MMEIRCTQCGERDTVPEHALNKCGRCNKCHAVFYIRDALVSDTRPSARQKSTGSATVGIKGIVFAAIHSFVVVFAVGLVIASMYGIVRLFIWLPWLPMVVAAIGILILGVAAEASKPQARPTRMRRRKTRRGRTSSGSIERAIVSGIVSGMFAGMGKGGSRRRR